MIESGLRGSKMLKKTIQWHANLCVKLTVGIGGRLICFTGIWGRDVYDRKP